MSERFFFNSFPSDDTHFEGVNREEILQLICVYVDDILLRAAAGSNEDKRGDLYVGDAGIAFMFLQMQLKCPELRQKYPCLNHARSYIDSAKANAKNYSKRADERCAFLLGNAGIYATASVISEQRNETAQMQSELDLFYSGFEACKPVHFNKHGSDEVLVGRTGYLSGVYWLNDNLSTKPFQDAQILEICDSILKSGREYSQKNKSPLPLMYQYHGSEYLGAAHGVCAILLVLLQSPLFKGEGTSKEKDIKQSVDAFLALQDAEGNFPIVLNDLREKRLLHWCHGAPGAIYLFAKAFQLFKEEKYLNSCRQAAELIWAKGLLRKGPGICHGVAGNGYAFLLMFRLTGEKQFLYKAMRFAQFLKDPQFKKYARTPDRPYSLYEGLAGTVCFLVDLLAPESAAFPFMNVF